MTSDSENIRSPQRPDNSLRYHDELFFSAGVREPWTVPLPSGSLLNPSFPDSAEITEFDVLEILKRSSLFAGLGPSAYPSARHALLCSYLFSDPKLALAGLLYSLPEAFYGRLISPVMAALPVGSVEIYRRFCAAFRRSTFARFGLADLTRMELELVLEREATAWNAAYVKIALFEMNRSAIDEAIELKLSRAINAFQHLRDAAVAGDRPSIGQISPDVLEEIRELFAFEWIDEGEIQTRLETRLRFLMQHQDDFRTRQEAEPELVKYAGGFDAVLTDDLAYPPIETDDIPPTVGVPAVSADEDPITESGGEAHVDWAKLMAEHPELKPAFEQLLTGARLVREATERRALRLAKMQISADQGPEEVI